MFLHADVLQLIVTKQNAFSKERGLDLTKKAPYNVELNFMADKMFSVI